MAWVVHHTQAIAGYAFGVTRVIIVAEATLVNVRFEVRDNDTGAWKLMASSNPFYSNSPGINVNRLRVRTVLYNDQTLITPEAKKGDKTRHISPNSALTRTMPLTYHLESWLEPPATPNSISIPSSIQGGSTITVSWGAVSGATSYIVDRSVNGGGWSQVYNGAGTSILQSITSGWNTVAFRVMSVGSGGNSEYRTSITATIQNFPNIYENFNGVQTLYTAAWENVGGTYVEIGSVWENINGVWIQL